VSVINVSAPLDDALVASLRSGEEVLFQGTLYVARDRAHERMSAMIARGEALPFDARGQVLYYMGPSPAPPGMVIGGAGPTTSSRMDPYTDIMLAAGIRCLIGKGRRGAAVKEALVSRHALYCASFGGAAAYLHRKIIRAEIIAFEDLGPEALYRLQVKDFPAVVVNDMYGGDLYERSIRA
jgi:fumarate hydratase subunit beta